MTDSNDKKLYKNIGILGTKHVNMKSNNFVMFLKVSVNCDTSYLHAQRKRYCNTHNTMQLLLHSYRVDL